MKTAMVIVRTLVGLLFLFASVTYFLPVFPPPEFAGKMKTFFDGVKAAGYLLPLAKTVELLCGLAFVSGKFVPLAVVLIAPVAINILLINLLLAPEGLVVTIPLVAGLLFLAFYYRQNYVPLLAAE